MFVRALASIALIFAACEKTDHESIDKWARTEKGPGKLAKALADENLDADLSAHAAANLIKPPVSQEAEVRDTLEKMSPGRRTAVLGKLAPRLWDIARIENEMKLPNTPHVAAKDALVTIRKFADDAQRTQIDGYLADWYGVASYEGRAQAGQYSGSTVVRMVGQPMAKKLIEVMNAVVSAPAEGKSKLRVGDELMLALAASGSPDAIKKLLDVSRMDLKDPTLATRSFDALYKAYVDPGGLFDIQSPEPIEANMETLLAIAKDDTKPNKMVNDAIKLIRAIGPPKCFPPLLGLISTPHKQSDFKYLVGNAALRCGGAKSIVQVVRALPEGGAYEKDELVGAIASEIAKMTPRDQALAAVRELLDDKGTVTRWTAIEALAIMKSVDDKPKIAALTKVKDRLIGYWGEAGKTDPTLGDRAKELADQLGK